MDARFENIGMIIDREAKRLLKSDNFESPMPSASSMTEIMQKISSVVFYELTPCCEFGEEHLRRLIFDIYMMLGEQISLALNTPGAEYIDPREAAMKLVENLHEIKRMLSTDVAAIMHNDPAAQSAKEVVASYPAIKALLHYRTAHFLLSQKVPVIPRLITELAHSATGIDIHPGAVIGEYFGIDHGTGVVIGETCIIGNHVTLYQGVTLGARNFEYDEEGLPMNVPRHPIIEDNVTIYSNTSVLGRINVGHDTIIGGNVWLTESVPPRSRVTQGRYSDVTLR